jgi:A/G-specific adenine glycosylase
MAKMDFQGIVWNFYREHGRHDLPWRREVTPYGVFVSEIMLQQTQVSRVLGRWERWIARWPGFAQVADASVAEVVGEWQGLGYNRRVLRLREAAAKVTGPEFDGVLPREPEQLVRLPGVGPNTAGSVAAFAYNEPVVFIETNIRRVFLHHFAELTGSGTTVISLPVELISDAELRPLIEATLDRERPREWYWALMDYGAELARRGPNPNRQSKHYTLHSRFEGSVRQLRGEVLRQLLNGAKTRDELTAALDDSRLEVVLVALVREGFITERDGQYSV